MNILFTCAGRRTYLLKYFREQLGSEGTILGADMQLSAPALSVADIKLAVPGVYADNYVSTLLDICKQYKVNALISLNDLELPILSKHKGSFEVLGVNVVVSSPEVIDICFDKFETAKFIESLGLKSPKTFIDYNQALDALKTGELQFPLVLKPRWGSGSIGIEFVEDYEELEIIYHLLEKKIKKSILKTASSENDYILIQEKIEGPEYGLDVMNDLEGNHIAVSVKQKLAMRAGETDKAVTVDNAKIREIGATIGKALRHIANLDCDILEQDGEYYVLELNPRFGGGFPFSYEAGVNLPGAIIKWLKKEKVDAKILQPEYGKMFAKCDYLVNVNN